MASRWIVLRDELMALKQKCPVHGTEIAFWTSWVERKAEASCIRLFCQEKTKTWTDRKQKLISTCRIHVADPFDPEPRREHG